VFTGAAKPASLLALIGMQPRPNRNARQRHAANRLKIHSATGLGQGTVCTPDPAKFDYQPRFNPDPKHVTCNKCRKKLGLKPWFEYEGNE
jgi:hypothetical protein